MLSCKNFAQSSLADAFVKAYSKSGGFWKIFCRRSNGELCGNLGCAPKARVTCGGRFHPENCRLVWKLTSGLDGQPAGPEPRDKGRLGRLSDPAGRNVSEV